MLRNRDYCCCCSFFYLFVVFLRKELTVSIFFSLAMIDRNCTKEMQFFPIGICSQNYWFKFKCTMWYPMRNFVCVKIDVTCDCPTWQLLTGTIFRGQLEMIQNLMSLNLDKWANKNASKFSSFFRKTKQIKARRSIEY